MITRNTFIKKYKGKLVPFSKLPTSYQLALVMYMTFDGEAWDTPDEEVVTSGNVPSSQISDGRYLKGLKNITKYIKKNMSFWVKKYGKQKFGMVEVPMKDFCELIFEHYDIQEPGEFNSFEDYHKWYMSTFMWKKSENHYSEVWPGILDSTFEDNDVMQDGWHRFHTYVEQGKKVMPLLYYP